MEKIKFINGQAPYINDTNLNKLQDNIEAEIDSNVTHKYSQILTEDTEKGATITLPASYKVRSRCIGYIYKWRKTNKGNK